MKIVIDIPEEIYERYKKVWTKRRGSIPESCIAFGTPLPKGHGRLIDADDLIADLIFPTKQFEAGFKDLIGDAPTIIEADKKQGE